MFRTLALAAFAIALFGTAATAGNMTINFNEMKPTYRDMDPKGK